MQPALLGGLFIGVLSALPVVNVCNCCCVWLVAGGALAAHLQQQQQPSPITVLQGARAGLLAGVVGAFVWLVVSQALAAILAPMQERFAEEMLRNARDLPPWLRDIFEQARDGSSGGAGEVIGFLLMLFGGSAMAAIGGAAGAAYFRNDVPPALGGPINPPPLP